MLPGVTHATIGRLWADLYEAGVVTAGAGEIVASELHGEPHTEMKEWDGDWNEKTDAKILLEVLDDEQLTGNPIQQAF